MRHTLSILLLSLPLAAQGDVIPRWLTNSPGSGDTNWPFGLASACRVQYLYEAAETGLAGPRVITAFELRAEQGIVNAAKSNIDLQIEMSQTPITMTTATNTFANNRGANHAVVFARRLVSMPASTAQTIGAWTPPFVLDAPFVYDPTGGDSLLIEYDVLSQPTGTWRVDCAWSAAGVHSAVGAGCNGVGANSTGGQLGGSLTISCTAGAANANAPGALLIGATEWPTPLPVPGSPGCFSFSSLDVVIPVTLSATGTYSFATPVPAQQSVLGGPLFGQYAIATPSLTIDTSPSRRMFVTDLDQVARVYNLISNVAGGGTLQVRVALAMRLQ
jgi:hypothetical protein